MSLASVEVNNAATRVLVVDDSAADRNLVRLSLLESPHLYKLECAERLSEGLAKLENDCPDIVLLDLNLPDSAGRETVQRVAYEAPQVPILVLTGSDDEQLALDAVRIGAQDYIVKGQLDSSSLARAMQHAIDRHQVLRDLQQSRQKQLSFKDKFLSHVLHELRTPVACIHQYTEVMLDGLAGPLTPKETEYLKNILRNAGQLNNLIDDLLDAASTNMGKVTIELGHVQPQNIFQQIIQMLGNKAKGRGVTLTTRVEGQIPAVMADRRRLLQVFINLIDNALKFTDPGGAVKVHARVYAEDPAFVEFRVTDTGKGIKPENIKLIFDRLFQEENAVSNRHGLGLGLAISEEIVNQHGGKIWAESEPGKGSSFFFTIPIFSLSTTLAPVLAQHGKIQQASIIAIEILHGAQMVSQEVWDLTYRKCRGVVERCVLPDKDILLPLLHDTERKGMMFILACADPAGVSVLEKRILGQLKSERQIVDSCVYKTSCIALPTVPADKSTQTEQLGWIAAEIERVMLRASIS